MSLRRLNRCFVFTCFMGIILSAYAFYVELKKEENDDYVATCDISEHISCTKAFASKYGKGFGIIGLVLGADSILNQPNSLLGIFFYLVLAGIGTFHNGLFAHIQLGLVIVSNILSIYLACVLYFALYDFCVVCVGTYVINAFNLVISILKVRAIRRKEQ